MALEGGWVRNGTIEGSNLAAQRGLKKDDCYENASEWYVVVL